MNTPPSPRRTRGLTQINLFERLFNPLGEPAASLAAPSGSAPLEGSVLRAAGGSQPKRTVRVTRRRDTATGGAAQRPRATAPRRQRPSSSGGGGQLPDVAPTGYGGGLGSGGGGMGSGGGGQFPRPSGGFNLPSLGGGGCSSRIILIVVLLVVCYLIFTMFSGGGGLGGLLGGLLGGGTGVIEQLPAAQDDGGSFEPNQGGIEQAAETQPVLPRATPTRRPASGAGSSSGAATAGGDKWLIMLYQDADDKVLERDIYVDLNEAERVGSSDNVQIIAQIDRYRGGYSGDGNWVDAKRFYVTQDNDLESVGSRVVQELGEVNMADAGTLVDFVTWAASNYPADKYVLILSDHGMGWPGGWTDPTSQSRAPRNLPLADTVGDLLFLNEIDAALEQIRSSTGIDKLELVGMDACLMSHLEVFTMLEPHARYAVASQETEPALGWAYTAFLDALQQQPAMTGGDLGRLIVESYIDEDQRIVDDAARAELTGRGSPLGGLFDTVSGPSAAQVSEQMARSVTLTAADLSKIPALNSAVNDYVFALQGVNQKAVAQARTYAQSFTNVFGSNVPASYLDLANFVQVVAQQTRDQNIMSSGQAVLDRVRDVLVAERSGSSKPGATGVSIYFPNSQLYGSAQAGPQSYNVAAERFVQTSLWDEFLAFHYTGRQFAANTRSVSMPDIAPRAPAGGGVSVSPITTASSTAAPGEPVLLSVDINADNLGHVKLFVAYLDAAAKSLNVIDSDFLESPETRSIEGVYYPEWGEGEFTLEFEWDPFVTAITDGTNTAVALFEPERYGMNSRDAVYTVNGIYTYADGEQRYARLYFRDKVMFAAFGFGRDSFTGAAAEIIPSTGDKFTVLERWMDLDDSGNVAQTVEQEGATLTFGDDMFRWTELNAAAGKYVVGLIAEDLDGSQTPVYTSIDVR